MKMQEIVDYLIKNGNVYIKHEDWWSQYSWSVDVDGYNLAFEIEVTKLKNRPDRVTQRLFLTEPDSNTVYYTIADTHGFKGNPGEILAKIRHWGMLDGKL